MKSVVGIAAALSVAALVAGCSSPQTDSAPTTSAEASPPSSVITGDVTVFAAASLKSTFTELGTQFEKDSPGTKVTFNFAGSSDLVAQLTQGAPADVFASADEANMTKLTAAGNNQGDPVVFATNQLEIIVAKGNPKGIQSLDDFCGKTIALQRGTTQDDVATAQQAKCKTAGKPLKVLKFDTDPEALLQIKQGRAVADMNDFPVAAYTAKTDGGFEVVGEQIGAGPYGIAVPKDQTQLRDAIQKAVQALIDNGEYAAIVDKWQVKQGSLKTATVNAGT